MTHNPLESADIRIPISPTFWQSMSMWSGLAPTRLISPPAIPTAARYVAASILSGTTACSTAPSFSTPSITIVDVPAPRTLLPIRLRKEARSAISGSRAAFSIIVVPSAKTAAIIIFSVAPTLGNSKTMRLPRNLSQWPSMYPCSDANFAPNISRPRKCMSIGLGPKSSPPGSATLAFPYLASRGPNTTMEALIFSTSSYGASAVRFPGFVISSEFVSTLLTVIPSETNNSDIKRTSVISGTLVRKKVPSANEQAAITLSAEFLAPFISTSPCRGPLGLTIMRSITQLCYV